MRRLSLSNDFMEGANNVYLFTGDRTVLVDTGFDDPSIREELERKLRAVGLGFDDIDGVVLTHYHIDHCALAAAIQRAGGATVSAHPDDIALIRGDEGAWSDVIERRRRMYDLWGMPAAKRSELEAAMLEEADSYDQRISLRPIEEGDSLVAGETELRVLHTPGHSAGHVSLRIDGRRELLSGDALLPHYTPNVGGADVRVERPLEQYLETLERIAGGGFRRAWPGHREPIDEPADRAREIIDHHEVRAWRVANALQKRGAATPWEVSADLFGALEGIHILHGPGEVYAHLDHLSRSGAVERVDEGYRLTADGVGRLKSHPDEHWPLR